MIVVLQHLSWVSVHKYSSEIVVANEFRNLNLTCDEKLQGKHADCRQCKVMHSEQQLQDKHPYFTQQLQDKHIYFTQQLQS